MPTEVFMPKMSDHMTVGIIAGWLVKEGDRVEKGQPILEVETDKTIAEIEAPAAGTIRGIRPGIDKGSEVPVGETIAYIAKEGETVPQLSAIGSQTPAAEPPAPTGQAVTAPEAKPVEPEEDSAAVRATPVVRRMARELGIPLASVKGSGPAGRITEADLKAFQTAAAPRREETPGEPLSASPIAKQMALELGIDLKEVKGSGPRGQIQKEDILAFQAARPQAQVQSALSDQPAEGAAQADWIELTKTQKVTGQRMTQSFQSVPQFNLTVEVDMTNMLAYRDLLAKRGAGKVTVTTLLVKAAAGVLRKNPRANASFQDGRLKINPRVNIGVAVGSEEGLLVPVVTDADQKTIAEIDAKIAEFKDKAARLRFAAEDLSGGTLTISNLGMFGIQQFTAIVNPPESAILAVGEITYRPVCLADKSVAVRPMMMLNLAVDHRSMDGMQAARLLAEIKDTLEQPVLLFSGQ